MPEAPCPLAQHTCPRQAAAAVFEPAGVRCFWGHIALWLSKLPLLRTPTRLPAQQPALREAPPSPHLQTHTVVHAPAMSSSCTNTQAFSPCIPGTKRRCLVKPCMRQQQGVPRQLLLRALLHIWHTPCYSGCRAAAASGPCIAAPAACLLSALPSVSLQAARGCAGAHAASAGCACCRAGPLLLRCTLMMMPVSLQSLPAATMCDQATPGHVHTHTNTTHVAAGVCQRLPAWHLLCGFPHQAVFADIH